MHYNISTTPSLLPRSHYGVTGSGLRTPPPLSPEETQPGFRRKCLTKNTQPRRYRWISLRTFRLLHRNCIFVQTSAIVLFLFCLLFVWPSAIAQYFVSFFSVFVWSQRYCLLFYCYCLFFVWPSAIVLHFVLLFYRQQRYTPTLWLICSSSCFIAWIRLDLIHVCSHWTVTQGKENMR